MYGGHSLVHEATQNQDEAVPVKIKKHKKKHMEFKVRLS